MLLGEPGVVALTPIAIANLLYQGVIVTFASYLTWFWLLTRYRASQLGVFSFMTPVFGVLLGVLLLDDPLTAEFAIGTAGVVAGILIVSAYPWLETLLAKARRRPEGACKGS